MSRKLATIGDALMRLAVDHPDRPAIVYLPDGESPADQLTYAQLDARARGIAGQLRQHGLTGERALLTYANPVQFVTALFGCLYAGVVAVPVGASGRHTGHPDRLAAIARDCEPAGWLMDTPPDGGYTDPGVTQLRTDTAVEVDPPDGPPPTPDRLAILQYTSGTTAAPRGVMVTHANVLANVRGMDERGGYPRGETTVTWLPLYHDMGLFGGLLHTLYAAGRCVLMPPVAFLRRPIRWLRAISDYHAFVSGGPDFGYDLCVRRIAPAERDGLDLSDWRIAFNGAEPVRADTIDRFSRAFADAGFARDAFTPLYGLAETTLMATGPERGKGPTVHEVSAQRLGEGQLAPAGGDEPVARLVSCGIPVIGTEVEIVELATHKPVPPGTVGEIWLRGDSVARGYWRRPAETAELFDARLASEDGPHLRTGDLGALVDGELVVTGRHKDLLIVRGVNHYPHDIEESARRAIERLRPGAAAAFAVEAGDRESLVLVQELPLRAGADPRAICEEIVKRVAGDHGVALDLVVLVRPGQVPTTSSGKVQRGRCRDLLHAGELKIGYEFPPRADVTELTAIVGKLLGRPAGTIRPEDPLTVLGLDSLAAAELQERLRQSYGVEVDFVRMLAGTTVGELATLLAGADRAPAAPAASTVESGEPFPLTELQQAYLVGRGESMPLGGVGTHSYLEFRHRDLDVPRLVEAWQSLVRDHAMLRAVLTRDGRQRILPPDPVPPVAVDDLRAVDDPTERLLQTRHRMERQVHDPYTPPVYEIRISLLPGGEARIHLSFDLLIVDAPSILQLMREWGERYDTSGSAAPAGPSFREYIVGRRPAPTTQLRERAAALHPGPGLPLATDPAALGVPTFHRHQAHLGADVLSRLRAAARRRGLTLSALIGAAYAETLATFSEQRPFSLNVTSFERPAGVVGRRVVGEFTSLLLVPVEPPAGEPFERRVERFAAGLLGELRQRELTALALMRERTRMSGSQPLPLAPVVFTSLLEDAAVVDWLGELEYGVSQTPQVWLDHQLYVHRGALVLVWDAVNALFPTGLLDAMFDAYQRLLQALADREDWSASGRELMGLPDLAAVLPALRVDEPPGSLDVLVYDQATRTPDADAVRAADRTMSYQELSDAGSRLGAFLSQVGVRRQDLVVVALEKGWRQPAAVLGVLTAGAAYVPVDPEVPAPRLAELLTDSRARWVLTDRRRDWPSGVRVIDVDDAVSAAGSRVGPRSSTDLAYVIYTSGSTGAPKGVAIEHGAAANTVIDINERYAVGAGDRVLGVTPLTFDLSVYDLFGPLAVGGALVLPEHRRRAQPDHWAELMRREGVTIWNSVPALLRMLWDDPAGADRDWARRLRVALLSGDWIPVPFAAAVRRALPDLRLVSLGGATEASIWSVLYEIGTVDESWPSIPYGHAMRDQAAVVLDESLAPRPVWVPGPLYLAGAGLAREYLHDPDRTGKSFLIGPGGGRLYRTGDLARLRPDGELELLGREDDQLKVQGHRIEPGEVEEALTRHPAVREAVVGATGQRDGLRRLVAYVRTDPTVPGTPDGLLEHVGELLPRHLVPDAIRVVDAFPLTPNGKVDRRALFAEARRAPESSEVELSEAGNTATEQRILQVVGRVAETVQLSGRTKLAELELSSMELIQLGAALEQEFGHRPDLATMYRLPDLAALARFYAASETPAAPRIPAARTAPDARMPVSAASQATVLADPAARATFKRQRRDRRPAGGGVVVGLPDQPAHPAVESRRSARHFGTGQVPVTVLADWLSCLREHDVDGEPRRGYGSAGGLYPVEVYLQVTGDRVAGLGSGVYQYDPRGHQLLLRSSHPLVGVEHHWPENRRLAASAACAVFLVADLAGITPIYGELSEQFCHLEAGAIAQLLATSAPEYDLGVCPIGFVDFGAAAAGLALTTPDPHRLVHSLLAGPRTQPEVPAAAEVGPAVVRVDELRGDVRLRLPRPAGAPYAKSGASAAPRSVPALDKAPRRPAEPEAVLITGATGFLGRRLVAELVNRTNAVVYGLVTADDPDLAQARIMNALRRDGIPLDAGQRERIVGLPGDLAAPWLGLTLVTHQRLADELDLILHAGASVHWLAGYQDVKPVNVTGTGRVLELAAAGRRTRLVHVSTVAVFPFDQSRPIKEQEPLDHGGALLGGYPQSKWVAEKLVESAVAQGVDAIVVRPGTITGHSRSGAFQRKSFLESFLAAVLTVGWAPSPTGPAEALVDLSPVDYVAAATVALALRDTPGGPYHLVNPSPLPLSTLYEHLAELGYRLRHEPYPDWRRRVLDPAVIGSTALAPFAGYLAAADERFLRMPRYDCSYARRDLAAAGITCPAPDQALLARYLAALRRAGLLGAVTPQEVK